MHVFVPAVTSFTMTTLLREQGAYRGPCLNQSIKKTCCQLAIFAYLLLSISLQKHSVRQLDIIGGGNNYADSCLNLFFSSH